MAEGLRIVNEIYERAQVQYDTPAGIYVGINIAIAVLSDPENADLWRRLQDYMKEEDHVLSR